MRLERKIPLASYDEIAPSLKTRVARDERTELSKQDLQNKLRKEYQLGENEKVKSMIMLLADSSLQKGKWEPAGLSKAEKETLFTLNEKHYSVKDFLSYVKQNQRTSTLSPEKYLDQLYNQYIDTSIIKLEEERIMLENPDYRFLLQEYYEGILLFDIMEKEVWSKASEDSIGQADYYNSHKKDYHLRRACQGSHFTLPATGTLQSLFVNLF